MKHLKELFDEHPSEFVSVIDNIRCEGAEHLQRFLTQVGKDGGEGVMLRKPLSMYERKR